MGRKLKFGEPTVNVGVRVPVNKKEYYLKHINNLVNVLNSIENERSHEEHTNTKENN